MGFARLHEGETPRRKLRCILPTAITFVTYFASRLRPNPAHGFLCVLLNGLAFSVVYGHKISRLRVPEDKVPHFLYAGCRHRTCGPLFCPMENSKLPPPRGLRYTTMSWRTCYMYVNCASTNGPLYRYMPHGAGRRICKGCLCREDKESLTPLAIQSHVDDPKAQDPLSGVHLFWVIPLIIKSGPQQQRSSPLL